MRTRSLLYGNRKEYCVVVGNNWEVLQRYEGTFGSVTFDHETLMELILDNKVLYILHSHPYCCGTSYSSLDKEVFEGWAVATGKPIVHCITDFFRVSVYVVFSDGHISHIKSRTISGRESEENWPWGVKLENIKKDYYSGILNKARLFIRDCYNSIIPA